MAIKTEQEALDEGDLLKALDTLERIAKGDDLADASTEGGLSGEGSSLATAKGGNKKPDLSKRASASDMAASGAEQSDVEKGDEGEDESGNETGEEDTASKSFRVGLSQNRAVREAVEVSDFCKGLVDEYADSMDQLEKALTGNIGDMRKALVEARRDSLKFNTKLAKGLVLLASQNQQLGRKLDALLNQPNVPARRSVLSKGEVRPAPFAENQPNVSPADFRDFLFSRLQKATEQERGPMGDLIIMAECNGFDPARCGTIGDSRDMQQLVKSFFDASEAAQ